MSSVQKSRTFLTEFIIVILFFSISAVILLNVFVKANDKSKEGKILDECSLITRNLEAQLTHDMGENIDRDSIRQVVEERLDDNGFIKKDEGIYVKYLDKDFKDTDEKQGIYKIKLVVAIDDSNEFSSIVSYAINYTNIEGAKEYYDASFNKIIIGKEE